MNNNSDIDTTSEWYDEDPSVDYKKALERAKYLKEVYDTEYTEIPAIHEQKFRIRNDLQEYIITDGDIENIINELYK